MAKQGLKKGQVTAKRAYEIADSLDKREQFLDINKTTLTPINERGERRLEEYYKNKADAKRIRSAADKAVAKATTGRDMPLPSSDGIMGTFTNFFKKK
jgi:hypothetical protein